MEYTVEQKAEALTLYEEHGAAEATRRLDFEITAGTIRVWAHRAGLKRYSPEKTAAATEAHRLRQVEMREEVRELFLSKALDLLLRIDEPHIDYRGKDADLVTFPKAPARECLAYMTAAATALDKYRLEMGEATARTHAKIETIETEVDGELRRATEEWKQQFQKSS